MQKINNELTLSTLVSKQNSPINLLRQENFTDFLDRDNNEEETIYNESRQEINIVMQSLQNTALLNRMIIESVA